MTDTAIIGHIRGDATGLMVPAHAEALSAGGEAFLTTAFQTFGALAPDNRVTRIVRMEPCAGGSTGHKLFLTVEYERPEPGLHTELFVKFSRDFSDPLRDHGRREMEPEARFAPVSRLPGFPIDVPVAYFADYHRETGTGMIITQRIAFGEEGIEPHRRKCTDHLYGDPLPYYSATVTAIARLAAAHKAGRLAPDIETRFPVDPATAGSDPNPYTEAELAAVIDRCDDFALRCPQLTPAEIRAPDFLAKVRRDAFRIRAHEADIQWFLLGDPDYVALCHWNAHIDNAWFWRDAAGALCCGLIDWGRVAQMNLGVALWGCLSAAHHDIWAYHLDELLDLFAREYRAYGGPAITVEALKLHLVLNVASIGVARVLAFPKVVLYRLPEAASAAGPEDPIFLTSDTARNCLHVYTVFLNLWRTVDFGAQLDRLLGRIHNEKSVLAGFASTTRERER